MQIIERLFFNHYVPGALEIAFQRAEIEDIAARLEIKLPKNIGDVIYSFRYRSDLPPSIQALAPKGQAWIIVPTGRSRYAFIATTLSIISPNTMLAETKIPDSTPGVIAKYALNDEQALLTKVRYNRLVDIFMGVTCYSLQNHLRTTVPGVGQVETDELYIGIDRRGAQYVFPIQAKGGSDRLSVVQIMQDFLLCEAKFPSLISIPIAAQFLNDKIIALFAFERHNTQIAITSERHFRLVQSEELTDADLAHYRTRPIE